MTPEHEERLQEIEDRLAGDRQRLKEIESLWRRACWSAFGAGLAVGLMIGLAL